MRRYIHLDKHINIYIYIYIPQFSFFHQFAREIYNLRTYVLERKMGNEITMCVEPENEAAERRFWRKEYHGNVNFINF